MYKNKKIIKLVKLSKEKHIQLAFTKINMLSLKNTVLGKSVKSK